MSDAHALFVFAAYAASALGVAALVLWVVLDGRLLKRELARLEAAGAARPSRPR